MKLRHYPAPQPHGRLREDCEIPGQGLQHLKAVHPKMSKTLPQLHDEQAGKETTNRGHPLPHIHGELGDWADKQAKKIVAPNHQTKRECKTDLISLGNTDLEKDTRRPGLRVIKTIQEDAEHTRATKAPPMTTCNERGPWKITEYNQQCENNVINI